MPGHMVFTENSSYRDQHAFALAPSWFSCVKSLVAILQLWGEELGSTGDAGIHKVTDLSWRGGTVAGAAQASGRCPGATLAYPLALDRLPPPQALSLQLG